MRILGLDVGTKTIGVAVSDPLGITAQGITTIERTGIKRDTEKILDLVREYGCERIVIGLPLNMDGSEGSQAEYTRDFALKLENKLRSNGLADVGLIWQDERLTSYEAEQAMIQADLSRRKRKKIIDRQAAVLILQGYLNEIPS